MFGLDKYNVLFVVWSFIFQVVLIIHFVVRKLNFDLVVRYGWIVYALCVVAVIVSIIQLRGGKSWSFWLGGFIYLVWAIFGYTVEYVLRIQWRNPINWPVLGPYLLLYLGTVMFYWWPLGLIMRPLWFVYAILFIISTVLNLISH